ncbi:unnamed protein product [Ambrosiozyma monospora]|uniref:Unnamed protein product n=1 Tax=Ambrosiozyma monospora TaxID=43982 RepID=A0A9W6Z1F2_AMBMO|nr:unnamed protein product [Ambrosiozyma monospora]
MATNSNFENGLSTRHFRSDTINSDTLTIDGGSQSLASPPENNIQRLSDDELNDPDTDNEAHARSQILRSKARSNSITSHRYYGSYTLISVLPPEILCLIFSYLQNKSDLLSVALTCKYWGELIIDLIWFRPGISNKKIFDQLESVMKTPKTTWNYRSYIKRLNLSLVPNMVTDDYLSLFIGATNLERITLVNCSKIHHQSVANILSGCSRLQSIDLTGVKDIQDDIYLALASNCKRLQGLYAPGSSNISKEAVLMLIDNCCLLKRVKLSDCNNVDDDVIMRLVKNCPNLVEIDLHGCDQVTNTSLHFLFSKLEFLKEFKISKNANLTYKCFESECVIKLAPKLRNVVLSKCVEITDASLRAIATLGKNLHYVHLGHCSNITDFGARDLIKSCYRLQYIDLACCTQLTNATVIELAQLQKLRRIGLVKCSSITDEGIVALADARYLDDTLERVHLSYCVNLTLYPIYKLLKSCPKLTHISLTGVSPFLRPDITRYCRAPPQEFNAHQKSIFCVFSGDGVNQLRQFLIQTMESPQDPAAEGTEVLEIISSIVERSNEHLINNIPLPEERVRIFIENLERFANDFHNLNIPRTHLELFARSVFAGLPASHVQRMQRFFQLLQSPQYAQQMARNRARNINNNNNTNNTNANANANTNNNNAHRGQRTQGQAQIQVGPAQPQVGHTTTQVIARRRGDPRAATNAINAAVAAATVQTRTRPAEVELFARGTQQQQQQQQRLAGLNLGEGEDDEDEVMEEL